MVYYRSLLVSRGLAFDACGHATPALPLYTAVHRPPPACPSRVISKVLGGPATELKSVHEPPRTVHVWHEEQPPPK